VLGKIKKALALGGHRGTGEAEAKRAMRSEHHNFQVPWVT